LRNIRAIPVYRSFGKQVLEPSQNQIPRPVEKVKTLVPLFTFLETRMDQTRIDKTSLEHFFEHYVNSGVNPPRVRKFGRGKKLERKAFHCFYYQDFASLSSLKSARGFLFKE
jgi:hypothetical protein